MLSSPKIDPEPSDSTHRTSRLSADQQLPEQAWWNAEEFAMLQG